VQDARNEVRISTGGDILEEITSDEITSIADLLVAKVVNHVV
jgi:hypothetical protein